MSNIHLKEAANNMRKAVADVRLLMQESQAEAANAEQSIQERLKTIAIEYDQIGQGLHSTNDDASKAQHVLLMKKLDDERKQLEQQIKQIHADAAKRTQELDKQAYEFDDLAKRLDMMA